MQKLIILIFSFASVMSINAQGIEFRDLDFAGAQEASAREDKPIFMDAYATWCGPCKWMSANIFTDSAVGEFYNENFICIKVDMEKGEGPELAKKYGVRSYPSLLYLNENGELLNYTIGASPKISDYVEAGKMALDPKRNMQYLKSNRAENADNPQFMRAYLNAFGKANMLEKGEVYDYLKGLKLAEWTEDENWSIINNHARNPESPVIETILENPEVFGQKGAQHVEDVLYYSLARSFVRIRNEADQKAYDQKKEKYLNLDIAHAGKLKFRLNSFVMQRKGNWEDYCRACNENVKKYYWDDAGSLNNYAWNFFENTDDPKNLEYALKWAKRAVELKPHHAYLDTYANLLLVNGQPEKALKTEKKAIEKAEAQNADTEAYEEVIEKIEAALKS